MVDPHGSMAKRVAKLLQRLPGSKGRGGPMLLPPEGRWAPSHVLVGIVLPGSAHLQAAWEMVRGQNGVQPSR